MFCDQLQLPGYPLSASSKAIAIIAHFQGLLAREINPQQRRVIEGLLVLERTKLEIAESQARDQSCGPDSPGNIAEPSR
ncbi:hypothetical protein ASD99_04965 [Mesorhizobium sp. Root695]|jgi:hypothetical protein|nr:hypothetical protein ASD12_31255 [Mesorhizobium sp. Root102]KRB28446.1 hypothetical protein ASD99_04965 [Mesorhizobium sp. Root695]